MKTTIFCVTILCLELASSYPDPLSSYYGSYEPVGVPDRVSQPIQISNIAHSQTSDLTHKQQQLAYIQQENIKRQNHENILRDQDQQRLIQPQPEHKYNNRIPLNTVREPYSIPLQRPIHQQFREPHQGVEAPPLYNVPNPKPQAVVEPVIRTQPNYSYSQQYQPVPDNHRQNVLKQPRIQQALASTPLKKRYLVLHPNGTIEHIDKIEQIVERYPNHILVNAGDLPKPNVYLTPTSANPQPLAPVAPMAPEAKETVGPVAPVVPLTPIVPPTPPSPAVLALALNAPSPAKPVPKTPGPPGAPPAPEVNATSITVASPTDVPTAAPGANQPDVVANATVNKLDPAAPKAPEPKETVGPVVPVAPLTPVVPPTPPSPAVLALALNAPSPAKPAPKTPGPPGAPPAPEVNATSITVASPTDVPTAAPGANQPDVVANATVNKFDPAAPKAPEPKETVGPVVPVAPLTPVVPPTPPSPAVLALALNAPSPAKPVPKTPRPPGAPPAPEVNATSITVASPTDVPTSAPVPDQPDVVANATVNKLDPAAPKAPEPKETVGPVVPVAPLTPAVPPTPPSPAVLALAHDPSPAKPVPKTPGPPGAPPAPEVNATSITVASPTDVPTSAPVPDQPDVVANVTVNKLDPARPDFPFEPPTKPIVWFRTTDLDFWDKLTSGKETYDIVYFFNVPHEPRVTKDTKTVIYANGTVLEEQTQIIYDDEDSPPREIKTTKITNPDDTQPNT